MNIQIDFLIHIDDSNDFIIFYNDSGVKFSGNFEEAWSASKEEMSKCSITLIQVYYYQRNNK